MNVAGVRIIDFLALGDVAFHLAERGLTLIQGVNRTNPSAKSNGAGKSSLVDAVSWALFGRTARGVTGDAVIRHGATKATVHLILQISDTETLHIHRARAAGKGSLTITLMAPGGSKDLTLGTEKLTQEVLERIIGSSYEVFRAAVYLGQEQMPDLPAMTDKQLKELIEEAAGVAIIERAFEVAKERHRLASTEHLQAAASFDSKTILAGQAEDELARSQAAKKEWDDHKDVRYVEAVAKAKKLQETFSDFVRTMKDEFGAEVWDDRLAITRQLADEIRKVQKAIIDLQKIEAPPSRERDKGELNLKIDALARELAVTKIVVAAERDRLSVAEKKSECEHCGKTLDAASSADLRKRMNLIAEHDANIVGLTDRLKQAKKDYEVIQAEESKTVERSVELAELATKLPALVKQHGDLVEGERLFCSMATEIAAATQRCADIFAEKNPHEHLVAGCIRRLNDARERRETAKALLEDAITARDIASDVVKVFGTKGVRAHILDQVTPFLNDRTAAYLDTLSDGTLKAIWTTQVPDSKGGLKEHFSIQVKHPAGEGFMGLSGGEKRKIRIACALALQDLVAGRATKPFKLFVADEIDDALDEAGLERLMTVLNEKAKERGTVLVISHNDLSDWISEVWTVTNDAGKASLEGV